MKFLKLLIFISISLLYNCKAKLNEEYYIKHEKKLYSENNKNDTIYFYFKKSKKEIKIKNYLNLCNEAYIYNFYNNNLFYKYPYYPNKYFYVFSYSNNINKLDTLTNNSIIEKDIIFLKTIKKEMYTFKNFKNLSKKEVAYFFSFNRFKTIYLIDENENKNDKIYLRKVSFSGNFPKIQ